MRVLFSRDEMAKLNIELLEKRGVTVLQIAEIAFQQQSRYLKNISMDICIESVEKILSFRDVFHSLQLGVAIDQLAETGLLPSPMKEILLNDLGMFGIDELVGLDIAGLYGVIGQTNFGDIDVNKPGIIGQLNNEKQCNTFLDDIVGAIAAAASTRVAQIVNEDFSRTEFEARLISIYDIEE